MFFAKLSLVLAIAVLVLVSSAAGQNHPKCGRKLVPTNRIVGGENAKPLEFPWQGSLQYFNNAWYHTCGCTLISERWVMTAAHCVDRSSDLDPTKYRFVGGEHDRSILEGTEVILDIEKIIISPLWNSAKIDGDVALLKLSRNIDLDGKENHLIPACLPDLESIDKLAGKTCVATGWGHTSWQGTLPDILQKVNVTVWTQSRCKMAYQLTISITDRMLCFGENEKGTCQGDSGGPLNCPGDDGRWYNYGATSFGVKCAGPYYPSVTARVPQFTAWIWKTIAAN